MDYKLIIFDVDGTLVETKTGGPFRETADDWKFMPGVIAKCAKMHLLGVRLGIATNQGGVAFSWSKFTEEQIQKEIQETAMMIGATYVSVCYNIANEKALPQYFHKDDPRRKPNPGMLLEIIEAAQVTKDDVLYVGDRPEDEQAAKNAGVVFQWNTEFF